MSISAALLDSIKAALKERIGIIIPDSRAEDLRIAASDVLSAFSISPDALPSRIAIDPLNGDLMTRLLPQLTINETQFFRHRSQIDALRHDVLPRLIATRRSSRHLRLWSAACATGEEPYSLSILIHELLGARHDWHVEILASDVDPRALSIARDGLYGPWSFRGVDPETRDRHFLQKSTNIWSINREFQTSVKFFQLNLLDATYFNHSQSIKDVDLILCRNVLIYFDRDDQRSVLARLHDVCAPGGMVMVGGTEHALPGSDRYHPESVRSATVLHKARPSASPAFIPAPEPRQTSSCSAQNVASELLPPPASTDRMATAVREAMDRGDATEAAERAQALRDAQPLSAVAHYLHGVVLREIGEFPDALVAFRRSVFLDGTLPAARLALADALQSVGHHARAERERQIAFDDLQRRNSSDRLTEEPKITVAQMLDLVSVEQQHALS